MNLTRFATMDVNMLLSLVNMQLRDHYDDLDDLCRSRIRQGGPGGHACRRRFPLSARTKSSSDRDPDHNLSHAAGDGGKTAMVMATPQWTMGLAYGYILLSQTGG